MLESLTLLLLFQLLGEALAYLLRLPLPGPVVGMLALFLAWPHLRGARAGLEALTDGLLRHLGLLFVPAGVGVMLHLGLLADWWWQIGIAVGISTALTMAVSTGLYTALRRRSPPGDGDARASGSTPAVPASDGDRGGPTA